MAAEACRGQGDDRHLPKSELGVLGHGAGGAKHRFDVRTRQIRRMKQRTSTAVTCTGLPASPAPPPVDPNIRMWDLASLVVLAVVILGWTTLLPSRNPANPSTPPRQDATDFQTESKDAAKHQSHRVDADGDNWPDHWPAHWRDDGLSLELDQISDQQLDHMYELFTNSMGPANETGIARVLRLGKQSAGRERLMSDTKRLPTAEIVPVDNHWITLEACQVASEHLRRVAGIESTIRPSMELVTHPAAYEEERIEAPALFSECIKSSPKKTETIRFFVTGTRAILRERGYVNFIFYHGNPELDQQSVLLSAWALRPTIGELKEMDLKNVKATVGQVTGIRLARNMIAPICYMLDLPKPENQRCLSHMGDSVEAMDLQDGVPSAEFIARLDRWESENSSSPEENLSAQQVAEMMISEAWRRAAEGDVRMRDTLNLGYSEHQPIWSEIDYSIPPQAVLGTLEDEKLMFRASLKNGKPVAIAYTWKIMQPHTIRYEAGFKINHP
jgi:hypothetical protein